MQCHNFIDWPTQLKSMRKWKDDGKFRYIGVTHYQDHAHEELERIIQRDKVDFLQINYSSPSRMPPPACCRRRRTWGRRAHQSPVRRRWLDPVARQQPLPDFVKPFASSWAQAF
jgi:hypothetical protein